MAHLTANHIRYIAGNAPCSRHIAGAGDLSAMMSFEARLGQIKSNHHNPLLFQMVYHFLAIDPRVLIAMGFIRAQGET